MIGRGSKRQIPDTTTLLSKAFISESLAGFTTGNSKEDNERYKFRFKKSTLQRKEKRKEKRQLKKQSKNAYFSKTSHKVQRSAKELPAAKVETVKGEGNSTGRSAINTPKSSVASGKANDEFQAVAEPPVRKKDAIDEDMDHYASLLKISKSAPASRLPKAFEEDGLVDFLDGLEADDVSSSPENDSLTSVRDCSSDDDYTSDQSFGKSDSDSVSVEVNFDGKSAEVGVSSVGAKEPTKYVPPERRNLVSETSQVEERVGKKLRGLINKLSLDSLSAIRTSLLDLYTENPRQVVSCVLIKHLLSTLTDPDHLQLNEIMVSSLAGLLCMIVGGVGVELAANFVQELVTELVKVTQAKQDANFDSQLAENLTSMLAFLYVFEMFGSTLMYDIVRSLVAQLNEVNVSLLLKIVKIAGGKLRSDSPSSLKQLVELVTEARRQANFKSGSRASFIVEALLDLKNNKLSRRLQSTFVTSEAGVKLTRAVVKAQRQALAEPLGVSLSDIMNIHTAGKWWLIGAAWTGAVPQEADAPRTVDESNESAASSLDSVAKVSGMNTLLRKQIFAIIMTSDDYADACQKLIKLNLNSKQSREIVWVAVQCCGRERTFNPYYHFVIELLAKRDYGHVVTLRFVLWDFLKQLSSGSAIHEQRRWRNIARLYSMLIQNRVLSLSIIKTVPFLSLEASQIFFLQNLLCDILFEAAIRDCKLKKMAESNLLPRQMSLTERRTADGAVADDEDLLFSVLSGLGDMKDKVTTASLKDGLLYFVYAYVSTAESLDAIERATDFATVYYPRFKPFTTEPADNLLRDILSEQALKARKILESEAQSTLQLESPMSGSSESEG